MLDNNNCSASNSGAPSSSDAAFALSENGVANNKRKRRPAGTPGKSFFLFYIGVQVFSTSKLLFFSFFYKIRGVLVFSPKLISFLLFLQIQMPRLCLSHQPPCWNLTDMFVRSATKGSRGTRIFKCTGGGTRCHGSC